MARKPPKSPALAFQDDSLLSADAATQNRVLDQMRAAGGRNLRINAIWGQMRSNGAYDWSKYDTLVNAARARGIAPQMTITGTPEYAAPRGWDMSLSADAPNVNLMEQFTRDVATHFKGRVKRYSGWNEPNINSFLSGGEEKTGAGRYRHLYQAFYKGLKSVDPHAQALLGELTSGIAGAPDRQQAIGFLHDVLTKGKKPLLADGLALHPYQWSDPNSRTQATRQKTFGGISNLGAVQSELLREFHKGRFATPDGKRKVPLYLTEFGYKGAQFTLAQRARYMQTAMRLAGAARAREMLWYQWLPTTSTAQQAQNAVQVQNNDVLAPDYRGRMRQVPGGFHLEQPPPKTIVTQGGPWDTSIADAYGTLNPQIARALKASRRRK